MCEHLLKQFCEDESADSVRLLFHTEIKWLSRENYLRRFMELLDILSEFFNDKFVTKPLKAVDGRAFMDYLKDIFEKLNMLNRQLQGANKIHVDAKVKKFS